MRYLVTDDEYFRAVLVDHVLEEVVAHRVDEEGDLEVLGHLERELDRELPLDGAALDDQVLLDPVLQQQPDDRRQIPDRHDRRVEHCQVHRLHDVRVHHLDLVRRPLVQPVRKERGNYPERDGSRVGESRDASSPTSLLE